MLSVPDARQLRSFGLAVLLAASPPGVRASAAQEHAPSVQTAVWVTGATLLGGSLLLDEALRALVPTGGGERWDAATDQLNHLGNPRYVVPVLALGYAGARLARAPDLSASSAHVLAALVASGVANGTIKYAVGRQRPVGGDALSFRPFNSSNRWQSFPSGHAVVAFSLAASISEEAGHGWVTALTYGTASLVGWSRIYADKHWTSDVVGGALIGAASSRAALGLIHRRRRHDDAAPAAILLGPETIEVRFRTW
ncbi:MAG: phosphatase PAP2 family protein [Gemmatimonadetes bacterium]|nr:phosphatase PAP2 family protein [Gemmatimonadota bacterium]